MPENGRNDEYRGRKPPLAVSQQWYREAREFMEKANTHFRSASTHLAKALSEARDAGVALIEAKGRVPYKKWGKFVDSRFRGSRETSRVYMRIARHWTDPRIEKARLGRMAPKSIQGFLDIIKGKPASITELGPNGKLTRDIKKSMIRDWIRKEFVKWLKTLDGVELEALEESFGYVSIGWYKGLKRMVVTGLEFDYYHEPTMIRQRWITGEITSKQRDELKHEAYKLQQAKSRIRRKVRRALAKGK